MMKLLAAIVLTFASGSLIASGGGYPLDRANLNPSDLVSLQSGARTFVNYCLNCHGAQYMRYNRLTALGLTEDQIRDNLVPTGEKIGETMRIAASPKDAKVWFGVPPPDLSVIARSRSPDWIYTYLRTFYRDGKTVTGWNNAVFPSVAMPHALWTLQGEQELEIVKTSEGGHESTEYKWLPQRSPGTQTRVEFDRTVRDLVNFMAYVAEPDAQSRKRIGIIVLFVIGVLFIFAWLLKHEFWKDVK